jgi:hypothetical protein
MTKKQKRQKAIKQEIKTEERSREKFQKIADALNTTNPTKETETMTENTTITPEQSDANIEAKLDETLKKQEETSTDSFIRRNWKRVKSLASRVWEGTKKAFTWLKEKAKSTWSWIKSWFVKEETKSETTKPVETTTEVETIKQAA